MQNKTIDFSPVLLGIKSCVFWSVGRFRVFSHNEKCCYQKAKIKCNQYKKEGKEGHLNCFKENLRELLKIHVKLSLDGVENKDSNKCEQN